MAALECCFCQMTWENDHVLITRCQNCHNGKYFCAACGSASHQKNSHDFTPNEEDMNIYNESDSGAVRPCINLANEWKHDESNNNNNDNNNNNNNNNNNKIDMLSFVEQGAKMMSTASKETHDLIRNNENGVVNAVSAVCVLESGKALANTGGVGVCGAGVVASQIGYHCYRWINGEINRKEFYRCIGKSITINSACIAASTVGYAQGASVAALIGAASTGGVIFGIVGAISTSLCIGNIAHCTFDKIFPQYEKEKIVKEKMLTEALDMFGYNKDSIKNKNSFNKKMIEKKYKWLSKVYHPDKGGSEESFQLLTINEQLLINIAENGLTADLEMSTKSTQSPQNLAAIEYNNTSTQQPTSWTWNWFPSIPFV